MCGQQAGSVTRHTCGGRQGRRARCDPVREAVTSRSIPVSIARRSSNPVSSVWRRPPCRERVDVDDSRVLGTAVHGGCIPLPHVPAPQVRPEATGHGTARRRRPCRSPPGESALCKQRAYYHRRRRRVSTINVTLQSLCCDLSFFSPVKYLL